MSDSEKENEPEKDPEPWVVIQKNTFTNWTNDKLKEKDLEVNDLKHDFKDGVMLCKLMECLKGRPIGKIIQKKKLNHYEASGNLALALNSMAEDKVRLVNIGKWKNYSIFLNCVLTISYILFLRFKQSVHNVTYWILIPFAYS